MSGDEVQQAGATSASLVAAMRAITVSRLYGSGGGEIATRLARRLSWGLIDHEIVAHVAQVLKVAPEDAELHDERCEGLVSHILGVMQLSAPSLFNPQPTPGELEQAYYGALRLVVKRAANAGHVVIVGRGAQILLEDRREVLHVRVVAPLERRVTYVARREALDEAQARARILLKDRDRLRFIQTREHRQADDPLLYDLVINTAVLDLDGAVDLICLALERKARRLGVAAAELGPGAGIAPYAGHPADLRPPSSGTGED